MGAWMPRAACGGHLPQPVESAEFLWSLSSLREVRKKGVHLGLVMLCELACLVVHCLGMSVLRAPWVIGLGVFNAWTALPLCKGKLQTLDLLS